MKVYSFGIETVPVAGVSTEDGILIIGSVKNGNYRIMLLKLNYEGELEWFKFFGGKDDWEGHSIARVNDGYLIGGAVEGVATPEGGRDWKAYLAKINKNGDRVWEKKYHILGNECVYSIVPVSDGILLGGEASDDSKRGFFLMKTDFKGDPLWKRTLGAWDDAMFGGIVEGKDGFTLIGSVKDDSWKVIAFEFDWEGDIIGEKPLGNGMALDVRDLNGKIFITGDKNGEFWVSLIGEWETTLREGAGTAIQLLNDGILVGGELNGNAIVAKLSFDGKLVWKKKLWKNGWVEVLGKGVALGVKEEGGKMVMIIKQF